MTIRLHSTPNILVGRFWKLDNGLTLGEFVGFVLFPRKRVAYLLPGVELISLDVEDSLRHR
jgi:hypothetical protein